MTNDATRAALDAVTAALSVTPAERRALREYQALSERGPAVNRVLRGETSSAGELQTYGRAIEVLDRLVGRTALPVDLVLFHGVRQPAALPDLGALPAGWSTAEFVSTSLARRVAAEAAGDGVVLRALARRGKRGLWLPPLGYRKLAYEEEVLLPRGSFFALYAWRRVDGLVEVHAEVMS